MRILVTGGAGFVASHLIDILVGEGHSVYVLDSLFTGASENLDPARLAAPDRLFFAQHDIIDEFQSAEQMKKLFGEDVAFDQIYHMACPASPIHYQIDPIHTMRTSVWGTYNALELAKRVGARLLLTSTSEVYGDPEVHPQPESYKGSVNCTGPRSCYDEGKRAAETLCFDYMRKHGVVIRIARIFNTYGPRMNIHDGRVISNFIVQAIKGDPITVYGDGSQTRSFCFVSDLARGLHALMNNEETCGPINLGNPDEYSMLEMAERIIELVQSTSTVTFLPLPEDDPKVRKPVIDLARRHLQWEPVVSLRDGITESVEYFRRKVQEEQDKEKST